VLADAAEPGAVAFACNWGRDRFDEVAQVFVGAVICGPWPSRPLTLAVTRGGSVQHVARSNTIWPGARFRRAALFDRAQTLASAADRVCLRFSVLSLIG
jgi:hypothetical protein